MNSLLWLGQWLLFWAVRETACHVCARAFWYVPSHMTGCLTLLEILEIYWNYFSSWKFSG